jgi:hypothetical protein
MSQIVYPQGDATVVVGAGESIAVASLAEAQIFRQVGFPNYPEQDDLLGVIENNTITVFGPYATGATIQIEAGATEVLYNVGTAPTIPELISTAGVAIALNATGTITSAMIVGGVITSTTAAAVTATLETGAVFDAQFEMPVGQSFTWGVVNTGGANAFTVTAAASGHTVVGSGVVANSTSATFRTIKTADATFVTYRLG